MNRIGVWHTEEFSRSEVWVFSSLGRKVFHTCTPRSMDESKLSET